MKLIKLIMVGLVTLTMVFAQNQQGGTQGPPPCDQWLNSDMAHDMNGDGVVDEGDCPGQGGPPQGPPPFEDVDTNGDGSIDRDEARDFFGHDDEGNADPEFDEEYDRIDTNGDGMVDHDEYMASDGGDHDGPQHYPNNHWDGNCGAIMNGESEYWIDSDGDPDNGPEDGPYAVWHEDADGNPVNCGPGPDHDGEGDHDDQGGKCGYDGCEFVGNSDEEWHEHCEANPEHCPDPVADTFFTTYAETQDYEAAFNAGAAVAQEMAQNEDDYNEDEWNEGRDCFHAAMTSYLDGGGDSPQGAMDAMYESGCGDDGDDEDGNDQN